MAQLAKGARYEYLVEELMNAIAASMFESSHPKVHRALQFVLDTLAFEPALEGEAQAARQQIETLLELSEQDVREARRQRAAGLAESTPLGACLDRMAEEDRRTLARSLVDLLVFCVSREPVATTHRPPAA